MSTENWGIVWCGWSLHLVTRSEVLRVAGETVFSFSWCRRGNKECFLLIQPQCEVPCVLRVSKGLYKVSPSPKLVEEDDPREKTQRDMADRTAPSCSRLRLTGRANIQHFIEHITEKQNFL